MIEIEKLAEELVNLTVKDVTQLSNILKEKYGIEPNPMTLISNNQQNSTQELKKEEEKSSFNVILKSAGPTKLKVIKAVKEILGKSLTEAKELVDSAPNSILKENINKKEADDIKKQFEVYGADIELN